MSELDLDAIRERAEQATPGPWEAGDRWVYTMPIYDDDNRLSNVLGMKYADPERAEAERERAQRNVEFIAHARTDVPALLTEVARLRKSVDRHRHFAGVAINETNEMRVQRDDAREELATAQKKLHAVATTKVWTNEDGRRFVFASDLAAACLGTDGEATS